MVLSLADKLNIKLLKARVNELKFSIVKDEERIQALAVQIATIERRR